MTISLRDFASGDTDYIAKLNSNDSIIEAAINALQGAIDGGIGAVTVGSFLDALFNHVTTLIGPNSYKPAISGTTLVVAAGGVYRATSQTAVESLVPVILSFSGQIAGTYYVAIDGIGTPSRSTSAVEAVYSVIWSGSTLSAVTRIVPAIFDGTEMEAARNSTVLGTNYDTLDARLEAGEAAVVASGLRIRKVGITLNGTLGIAGAIQIDFDGTIIGWSLIADQVGAIAVSVAVGRASPPAEPPEDPVIPDPVTDKISASAPITLVASPPGQSSASAAAGVSSWTTGVQMWDTIQFNVISATDVEQVIVYLRIQET